jgi:dTDP-glucose 4,6-dehydratase
VGRKLQNILVTGGCGFIGSNFIHFLFKQDNFSGKVVNIDKLTYAGNPTNLKSIVKTYGNSRYFFEQFDITDTEAVSNIMEKHSIDTVVHFAAETHVDRSILNPLEFINTNIVGTFSLIDVAKRFWGNREDVLFHHVSTDEVYGSLGKTGLFTESTPYDPRSPYSAAKASSDHLVRSFFHTYGFPITISNCSNNYGPYQFPEKLIPFMILNLQNRKPLPIYGDGKNIRDWLHVYDHSSAIWTILNSATTGETYNIGGDNEWQNIEIINKLIELYALETGDSEDELKELITFVKDRLGHDRRYAIDFSKINNQLGWSPKFDFISGLKQTIQWYLSNDEWIKLVQSGEYRNWIEENYNQR